MNHQLSSSSVTDRGHKQVSDLLTAVPLSHSGSQSDLEHGVALLDLLHTVEDLLHLSVAEDGVLWLQQWLLVLLRDKEWAAPLFRFYADLGHLRSCVCVCVCVRGWQHRLLPRDDAVSHIPVIAFRQQTSDTLDLLSTILEHSRFWLLTKKKTKTAHLHNSAEGVQVAALTL